MKTLLRSLLYLALIVWLGAEILFPVVAVTAFGTLRNDTHAAGTIVGSVLHTLHNMGLIAGLVALALLALAPAWHIYKPRSVLAPMIILLLMIALTAYSQYGIIPAMERDRIAAGGAIDVALETSAPVADFNRLHVRSERVEQAVLLLGVAAVVLVAYAETTRA
jgi:hypothetical protein